MANKIPKPVTQTMIKVGEACNSAIAKMQQKVLNHYQKHPDSAWSGHFLVDLEKSIKAIYKDMGVEIGKSFKKGLTENMQQFYDKAYKDVKEAGRRNAILGKPDTRLVKNYMESSFEEIAMRTTKMSFEHIRALRSLSADVLRTSSLTGASRGEVTRDFLARAQEIPGFKFTAANGAQWTNETYFKMLARTELMNAARASYDQKCADEGYDLVQLDYGGAHTCDACAQYEGTVFSLTGATPGYPTKADLEAAGVFHPNCTHSYSVVPNWNLPKVDVFPESMDDLTFVKSLGGSTHAKLFEDKDGNRFVMKRGGTAGGEQEAHLRNEFAVDNAYRALGIMVPDGKIIETPDGPVKLTRFVEGQDLGDWWSNASLSEREEMKKKLQKDFAIDVVLGNRDLVGMDRGNIKVDAKGNIWRIDNGAALGFRAQGARKADWETGSGADVVTMRTSEFNKEFFGDMDLLTLMKDIESRDFSKMLETLPDADRKIVEKRIEEIKAAIPRTEDFTKNSGYKPQAVDEVIKASMEMSVDGLAAKIPDSIKKNGDLPTDFKWFRTPYGSSSSASSIDKKNADLSKKIVDAAKTINHHNGSGGDHTPNKTTLNEAYSLMPELKKLADSGNSGAAYYLHRLEQIQAADKAGTTLNGVIVNSNVSVYSTVQPKAKVDNFSSFTAYMHDYISKQTIDYNGRKIALDPDFISISQRSQGYDSYEEDACKEKIVRLNAMGINPDDADKTYYVGHEQEQIDHFNTAKLHYEKHPDELERDTKTYLLYQAGIQHLFENCEFAYNDPKTHTIILARTVNPNLTGNSKEGELLPSTLKQGINESHSCYTARKLHTYEVRHLTLTRVPYSRISGCWMAERDPGLRNCGYLGDEENEIDADTNGLLVMLAKLDVKQGEPLTNYIKSFLTREKRGFN